MFGFDTKIFQIIFSAFKKRRKSNEDVHNHVETSGFLESKYH